MTPREITGWLWYARRRTEREQIAQTITAFNGARGDPKDLKKRIQKANKE